MSEETPTMRKPLVPLVAAAASACVGLSPATAGASDSSSGATPETGRSEADGIDVQVPDSKDRVDQYWTQDRMRAAKPMPTPQINRPSTPPAVVDDGAPEE